MGTPEIKDVENRLRVRAGDRREIGGATAVGYFRARSLTEGGCVAWVLRLVEIGAEGEGPCADVVEAALTPTLRRSPPDVYDAIPLPAIADTVLHLTGLGINRTVIRLDARDTRFGLRG